MRRKLFLLWLFFIGSYVVQAQDKVEDYVKVDSTKTVLEELSEDSTVEEEFNLDLNKVDSTSYPFKSNINLSDTVNKLLKQDDYWYVKATFNKKEKKKNENDEYESNGFWEFLGSSAFSVIMWVLFGGIILTAVLFFLAENDIISFRKKAAAIANTTIEDKEESIFEIDFETRIQQAMGDNNFKLATRLLLLRLLKNLSLKKHIHYEIDKTNLDYQIELSGKTFSQQVNNCFYFFDYVCYGDFIISNSQFTHIYNHFNETEKVI